MDRHHDMTDERCTTCQYHRETVLTQGMLKERLIKLENKFEGLREDIQQIIITQGEIKSTALGLSDDFKGIKKPLMLVYVAIAIYVVQVLLKAIPLIMMVDK